MSAVVSVRAEEVKKVLIITYVFPPAGYVGGFRTLKYCRYLPGHGWRPVVLTIDPKDVAHKDERLAQQIPAGTSIYRTLDVDPAKWIERRARRKRERAATRPSEASVTATEPKSTGGILGGLKSFIGTLLTDCPDSHVFWLPIAFFKGCRILMVERPAIVYSTSPPHSSHYIAFLLAKLFRKPYVVDFRDPWETERQRLGSGLFYRLIARLERASKRLVVRGAAKIICVTKGAREELRQEVPGVPSDRFEVVTNGFDPEDFRGLESKPRQSGKLLFVHSGTVYGGIAGEFFEALRILLREHPGVDKDIEVHMVGQIAAEYWGDVRELEATGLVRAYGLQPHATALQMVQDSDVPIILLGRGVFPASHIPAKVFEYLCSGKPILAIADDGELAEIVRKSGAGIVVPPAPAAALADALWQLRIRHREGRLQTTPDADYIRSFERVELARQLANVLDAVRVSA